MAPATDVDATIDATKKNNSSKKPAHLRPRRTGPSDVLVIFGVLASTALLSVLMLWYLGALGSGVWANTSTSEVTFITTPEEYESVRLSGHLVAVFYSESCLACKRMRSPFLAASAVVGDATFIAIDAARMPDLADNFKIQFIPSIFFVPSGAGPPVVYDGGPYVKEIVRFVEEKLQSAKDGEHGV